MPGVSLRCTSLERMTKLNDALNMHDFVTLTVCVFHQYFRDSMKEMIYSQIIFAFLWSQCFSAIVQIKYQKFQSTNNEYNPWKC